MSTENIVKMMFEYFRAIPEHIVREEIATMSVKVVHIGLKACRRSINE
ncbi:hypothetical protein AGMMS50222_00630 [Endomicrobiia bacterium]|nr:hypothetical protein AGMMS49531_00430 [Endomicrobiia bacterium]GHT63481.1 hypothetical protein AGMMS49556_00010 [Endomicrobiia bacterium]GHT68973.1 hypothetical protein AGMMS49950_00790 [Endomicrobiia bacterium]GHT73320.1 hypothetical protein AGMMS50222_00630 [Endomicrobiia bacterium]